MKHPRTTLMIAAALLGSFTAIAPAPEANAQAFCALRDPVQQVYQLFPEATSYRSIVRSVDENSRNLTAQELPFTLHFNELGRHTLYVALRGDIPLGVVHVRSEAGRWGLVEIAWALSLDLDIVGFRFQRCRDTSHKIIQSDAIASTFKGLDFESLRAMLNEDGDDLSAAAQPLLAGQPEAVHRLMTTTLRSAMKTVIVTKLVWEKDLGQIRLIEAGLTAFPNATSVEFIHDPYASHGMDAELHGQVGASSGIDRNGVIALLIRDEHGSVLGMKCQTPWSAGDARARVWWTLDATDRALTAVTADADIAEAFAALNGHRIADFQQCSTAVELAGKEFMVMANACLDAVIHQAASVDP